MPILSSRARHNVRWSEPESNSRTRASAGQPTSTALQPALNFASEPNLVHGYTTPPQLHDEIPPSYNSVDPFHTHSTAHTTSGQTIDDIPVFSSHNVSAAPISGSSRYHQPSPYHGHTTSSMVNHGESDAIYYVGSPSRPTGEMSTSYGQHPGQYRPHLTPYPAEPIVELPPRYQNHSPDPPTTNIRRDSVIVVHSDPQAGHSNIGQHYYEPVPASDGPYHNPSDQRPPSSPPVPIQHADRYEPVLASEGPYYDPYYQPPSPSPHVVPIRPADDNESLHSSKASDDIPIFSRKEYIFAFILDTLPRRCYLYLHLGLPALYFSRVSRIFKEADMSMPEIKKMALELPIQEKWKDRGYIMPVNFESPTVPAPYENLKYTWESFIDSLMREWKTFNIISVLLLSAILTILQIQSAAADTLTRYSALMSLICALFSLLYGCMYIIRFGGMRKTHKAAEWAFEAQKTGTSIFWNVWVLLAMPLIWLAWSIILYMLCIMSFVWRTGSEEDDAKVPAKAHHVLGPRLMITFVFILAITYFIFIFSEFRRYGDVMDEAWSARVKAWLREKAMSQSVHQTTGGSAAQSRQPSTGENLTRPQPYEPMSSRMTASNPDNPSFNVRPSPALQTPAWARVDEHPPVMNPMPYQATASNPEIPSSNVEPQSVPQPPEALVRPISPPVRTMSPPIAEDKHSGPPRDMATTTAGPSQRISPEDLDAAAEGALAHITYQANSASPQNPSTFKTTKVLDMRLEDLLSDDMKIVLRQRRLSSEDWAGFLQDASKAWESRNETYPEETSQNTPLSIGNTVQVMQKVVQKWNLRFVRHGIQLVVCREFFADFPISPISAVYMVNLPQGKYESIRKRFGPTFAELEKIDVWNPLVHGKITIRNEVTPYRYIPNGVATKLIWEHPCNEFRAYKSIVRDGEIVNCVMTDMVPAALKRGVDAWVDESLYTPTSSS